MNILLRVVCCHAILAAALCFAPFAAAADDASSPAQETVLVKSSSGEANGITVLGSPPPTVDEAVLFAFDDVSIPYTTNLKLTMQQPVKHPGNPLIPIGKRGEPDEWSVQCYGSVIKHDGKYKLWYIACDEECLKTMPGDVDFEGARVAYAESEDGVNWTKPNLGLVEYKGSKDNNLVSVTPAEAHGLDVLVLHEPDDPDPSRRFKMMVHMGARFDDMPAGAPVPFFSADGLTWRIANDAKLKDFKVAPDETAIPPEHFEMGGLYKWNGMYYLCGQQVGPMMWLPDGRDVGRVLTTFRSRDFVNWSPTKNLSFMRDGTSNTAAPKGVGKGEEVHQISVWPRGNVLLATYGLWHGGPEWKDVTIDLGFLLSNDGLRFREPVADHVFIERGADGTWDQGGLLMSQAFENIGDKTYIYYGHWDPRIGNKYKPRGGFGAVTLDRDRFAALSVKNDKKQASLVSSPLSSSTPVELAVNADGLGEDAWLCVSLIDEFEQPIPGFSGDLAARVKQSGLKQPVVWSDGKTAISKLEKPFKVKVSYEGEKKSDVNLYAVYLTK